MHWHPGSACQARAEVCVQIMCHLETDTVNECSSSSACTLVPRVALLCGHVGGKSCNNKM